MTAPKRKKREYAPEQKAAALAVLASCGGNTRAAARQLAAAGQRVPEATLRGWTKQPMAPVEQDLVDDAKRELDVILESVVGKIARGLDRPEAINRILSKPVQAGTVLGILVDKLRVLRGQSTENIATQVTYVEPGTLRKLALTVIEGGRAEEVS